MTTSSLGFTISIASPDDFNFDLLKAYLHKKGLKYFLGLHKGDDHPNWHGCIVFKKPQRTNNFTNHIRKHFLVKDHPEPTIAFQAKRSSFADALGYLFHEEDAEILYSTSISDKELKEARADGSRHHSKKLIQSLKQKLVAIPSSLLPYIIEDYLKRNHPDYMSMSHSEILTELRLAKFNMFPHCRALAGGRTAFDDAMAFIGITDLSSFKASAASKDTPFA
jgi:hypothetical protein